MNYIFVDIGIENVEQYDFKKQHIIPGMFFSDFAIVSFNICIRLRG